jgi:hypothetical protein
MADSGTANSPAPTEASTGSAVVDDLPAFAHLFNDEERERKAERASPGTYHVVVNPDSFQHLPEYSDEDVVKRDLLSPLRRGSVAPSLASSFGKESSGEGIPVPGDPNIVVLPRFEDVPKRPANKDPRSPSSPSLSRVQTKDSVVSSDHELGMNEEKYLSQFRDVVWRQLVSVELGQIDGMERSSAVIVEVESQYFPPVCLASQLRCLLTPLALSCNDGSRCTEHDFTRWKRTT